MLSSESWKKSITTMFNNKNACQILASLAASQGYFVTGTVNGWSGSALTKLASDFDLGSTENALIASIIGIGAMVGSAAVGKAADILGRRKVLLYNCPLMVVGWLVLATANNLYLMYLGRFLCGLSTGFMLAASVIYTGEICHPELRGRLTSLTALFLSFGILTTYVLGAYLSWRSSCYVLTIPPIIFFLSMYVAPESPYWYVLQGKQTEAEKSLQLLRGPHTNCKNEMEQIVKKLRVTDEEINYKELFKPRTRLPLLIALFTHITQQFSGANVLMMFTSQIYLNAGTTINVQLATVYTGIVQVVGTVVSMFFIDRLGRKILLSISALGIGIFTLLLAGCLVSKNNGNSWGTESSIVFILLAVFCYCLGCRPVPWILTAEVFNTKIRSRANGICHVFNRILNIAIIQSYPYAAESFGNSNVFFFFGTASIICGFLAIVIVPETKGKSLDEIQEYFESKAVRSRKPTTSIPLSKN